MKPTLLLVEPIHPKFLKLLEARTRVVRPEGFDEAALAAVAAREKIDAIIIRTKGCVTEKILAASPNLKVVGRHGVGVDHIDVEAAARRGIPVVYTPAGSRVAVAEHTLFMMLALAKNAIPADAATRRGDYAVREKLKSLQLEGKTLGVIGLGRIGTTVAEKARFGLGMKILYTDIVRYPAKERRLKARKVSLRALLEKSQVVTIHTPLDESTRGLIGQKQLSSMQPGAILINCARGAIVDTYAVAEALESGKLGGAGIDVFDPEIPPPGHPILKHPRALLSPHSAAQTPEANLGYAEVVHDVLRVLGGRKPLFPVRSLQLQSRRTRRARRPRRID